jgi:hypothetical protein
VKNSINLTEVDEHLADVERMLKTLRNRVAEVAEQVRIAAEQLGTGPAAAGKHRKSPAKPASIKGRRRRLKTTNVSS